MRLVNFLDALFFRVRFCGNKNFHKIVVIQHFIHDRESSVEYRFVTILTNL